MKKLLPIFLLIIVLFTTFAFVGCTKTKDTLSAPMDLSVENGNLTWAHVVGALSYEVKFDEEIFICEGESFEPDIFDYNEHTLSVRAVGRNGVKSPFSVEITYARQREVVTLPQLSAPYGITMSANRLMWSSVLNNNGYKIYVGDKTFSVAKNATYYDFTFEKDGTYIITMQTLGDGISYANSKVSSGYSVTIKDLKGPLAKLPQATLNYDAKNKAITWANKYSADVVSYELYKDGALISTFPADNKQATMHYALDLKTSIQTSYSLKLICNNGIYTTSNMSNKIVFPLQALAPSELCVQEVNGNLGLGWENTDLCDAYNLELDGVEQAQVVKPQFSIPVTISDGEHTARVRALGNNIYYITSAYSSEITFYTKDGKIKSLTVDTPQNVEIKHNETPDECIVTFDEVAGASDYLITIIGENATYAFTSKINKFAFTATTINDVAPTTMSDLTNAFALLKNGASIYLQARADAIYSESACTSEIFVKDYIFAYSDLPTPNGLELTTDGISWNPISTAIGYDLIIDGLKYSTEQNTYKVSFESGEHRVKVRMKTAEKASAYCDELLVIAPIRISTPTAVKITNDILSWNEVANSSGYGIYSNGTLLATRSSSSATSISLSQYIENDGKYLLKVVALTIGTNFTESAASEEVIYIKTDGAFGTEIKPFEIKTANEFLDLITENPTAYFSIKESEINFTDVDYTDKLATFSGTIFGNNALLKGININKSLFGEISSATISNLTFEIKMSGALLGNTGAIADSIQNSDLSNITVRLSGKSTAQNVNMGGIALAVLDSELTNVNVDYNFELVGANMRFGLLSVNTNSEFISCGITGNAKLDGTNIWVGASVEGNITLTNCVSDVSVTCIATQDCTIGGVCTTGEANLSGGEINTAWNVTAFGLSFAGVAANVVNVQEDTIVKGSLVATCTQVANVGGVARELESALVNVRNEMSITLQAKTAFVGGLVQEVKKDASVNDCTFAGELKVTAEECNVAGVAVIANDAISASMVGEIDVSAIGDTLSYVSGAVITGEDLTIILDGELQAKGANLSVIGMANSLNGEIHGTGSLSVIVSDCDTLSFAGAVASGNVVGELDMTITSADIVANDVDFGGFLGKVKNVELTTCDVEVNAIITATNALVGGVIISADSINDANKEVVANIELNGKGDLSGYLAFNAIDVANINIIGTLKLVGDGNLASVAISADNVSDVTSSVDMQGDGNITLAGVAVAANKLTNVTYDGDILLTTAKGSVAGIANTVNDDISNIEVKNNEIKVLPKEANVGKMDFSGLVGNLTQSASILKVTNSKFSVGSFNDVRFGGIASTFNSTLNNARLNYTFENNAVSGNFGGVFGVAKGSVSNLYLGTISAPQKFDIDSAITFGGIAAESDAFINVSDSFIYISSDINVPTSANVIYGGLFAKVKAQDKVAFSRNTASVTLKRLGAGSATIGGAVGTLKGSLFGVELMINMTDDSNDIIGGVAGEVSDNGKVECSYAKGKIESNGKVGGVVSKLTNANLSRCYFAGELITSSGYVAGLVHKADTATISDCYSLARSTSDNSAGLVWNVGNDVNINQVYFGGSAKYAVADSVDNNVGTINGVLVSYTENEIFEVGSFPYKMCDLSYGYAGEDFGIYWDVSATAYPKLKDLTGQNDTLVVIDSELPAQTFTYDVACNIYDLLPNTFDALYPSIVWVDESNLIEITNGEVRILDNGSGTLKGYLSGGVLVYTAPFTSSGYTPFAGAGTEDLPYVISDIKYLHHINEYPNAYFSFVSEDSTLDLNDFVWNLAFAEDTAFNGVIDFNGVTFENLTIPTNGLFGYVNGGIIKNLTLTNASVSGCAIAKALVDSSLQNVNIQLSTSAQAYVVESADDSAFKDITFNAYLSGENEKSCAFIGTISGGSVENVCVNIYATALQNNEYFAERASGATFNKCVFIAQAKNNATIGFFANGDNLTITDVLTLIDADGEENDIVGFALEGEDLTFVRAVSAISAKNAYAFIKSGTDISYTDAYALDSICNIVIDSGVTALTADTFNSTLLGLTGWINGEIVSPCDISDLLTQNSGFTLEIDGEAIVLDSVARAEILEIIDILSDDLLDKALTFTFSNASVAEVVGANLVLKGNGNGTLTATDIYGNSENVQILVQNYIGFANGSGTALDPYIISNITDFANICYYSGAYFVLNDTISGTLDTSIDFDGNLSGSGTLNVEISDAIFTSFSGSISGITFNLTIPDSFALANQCGLFAVNSSNAQLDGVTINVINESEIRLEDGAIFGIAFAELLGEDSTIDDLTVNSEKITFICDGRATIGVIGNVSNAKITNIKTSGSYEIFSGNEVIFGGVVGEYISITEDEYAINGATANIALDFKSSGVVGGIVANLGAKANDLTVNISANLVGEDITFGGAVGVLSDLGEFEIGLQNVTVTACKVYVDGNNVAVGGAVGIARCLVKEVTVDIDLTVSENCGALTIGGAFGEVTKNCQNVTVSGNIVATAESVQAGAIAGVCTDEINDILRTDLNAEELNIEVFSTCIDEDK